MKARDKNDLLLANNTNQIESQLAKILEEGHMQRLADSKNTQWLRNIRRCLMKRKEQRKPIGGANYYQNDDNKGKQPQIFREGGKQEISPGLSLKPQNAKRKKR